MKNLEKEMNIHALKKSVIRLLLISVAITVLSACSNHQQLLLDSPANASADFRLTRPASLPSKNTNDYQPTKINTLPALLMSSGDKLHLQVQSGKEFSGTFTIDVDGYLKIPYLKPIYANGLTPTALTESVKKSFILEHIFKSDFLNITITPAQWSSAFINVKGAVYKPGNIIINQRNFKDESQHIISQSGDFAENRLLSSALKAAGGLRPDADLSRIQLIRKNNHYEYDLSGLISGETIQSDPVLINGDTLIIPSVGYLQKELFSLSRITPPGFRVFMSNLTVPASSNNTSAIGKYSSSLPLGSRLLTAAISANCVGGTQQVNAKRLIVLAGIDIKTNMLHVTQKSIEELLTHPNADQVNPYLLPNDHIACFDSSITNWRDIGRAVSDILSPLRVLGGGL